MKKKILFAIAAILIALVYGGCNKNTEENGEINPNEFSYDMLELSVVADEIYKDLDVSELTAKSVEKISDETFISEQLYIDLNNVISYDIRCTEGKYGVCDVAIIRVKEGKTAEVINSL